MGAGTTQMERSVLEKKGVAELQTIIKTLGGKPTARARKSGLVDMILELTGVPLHASDTGPSDTDTDADVDTDQPVAEEDQSLFSSLNDGPDGDSDHKSLAGENDDEIDGNSTGSETANGSGEPDAANRRRRRRRGREREQDTEDVYIGESVEVTGIVDLRDEGYAFLRTQGVLPSKEDVYISVKQVRQYGLRRGDALRGGYRPAGRNEKNPALTHLDLVNDSGPERSPDRPEFDKLTSINPVDRIRLEHEDGSPTCRLLDLISPMGKGQRVLIVGPPRADQSRILRDIARAVEANSPESVLLVVLIDERPEEVTEMSRVIESEVVASTFDRPADEHTSVVNLTLERAMRMAELGEDVVLIVDGISRLARAQNTTTSGGSRGSAGGIDLGALHPAKQLLGAARNLEGAGSITVIATLVTDSGSRIDEVITDQVVGAANCIIRLDRTLVEHRYRPAVDIGRSDTDNAELLLDEREHVQMESLRRGLAELDSAGQSNSAGLEKLLASFDQFPTNESLLADLKKAGLAG